MATDEPIDLELLAGVECAEDVRIHFHGLVTALAEERGIAQQDIPFYDIEDLAFLMLMANGNEQTAKRYMGLRGISSNPDHAFRRATVYLFNGQYRKAARALQEVRYQETGTLLTDILQETPRIVGQLRETSNAYTREQRCKTLMQLFAEVREDFRNSPAYTQDHKILLACASSGRTREAVLFEELMQGLQWRKVTL